MELCMIVEMPDGSEWAVPVDVIGESYAAHYGAPTDSEDELRDWAENDMEWHQVRLRARCISQGVVDYEDGWANGEKRFEEIELPE